MAELRREDRRTNRKIVLEALHRETGSWGGDAAAKRVQAYVDDPINATAREFGYVGGLTLNRFYVDPTKPNAGERASLWVELMKKIKKIGTKDPGGWDGSADVKMLQAIAEEA